MSRLILWLTTSWSARILAVVLICFAVGGWWLLSGPPITWKIDRKVTTVAFSPNGLLLASAEISSNHGTYRSLIVLRRVSDGQIVYEIAGIPFETYCLTFNADGTLLASGGEDSYVRIWRVRDGQLLKTVPKIKLGGNIFNLTFSEDGTTLFAFPQNGTVYVINLNTDRITKQKTFIENEDYKSIAFNPLQQLFAGQTSDTDITIWNALTDQELNKIHAYGRHPLFSPDGEVLASIGHDWTIQLWRVRDGQLLSTLTGHTDTIHALAFSPDSRVLASASGQLHSFASGEKGSGDSTVRLWSVPEGRPLTTWDVLGNNTQGLAFSPDGRWLASGGMDARIRLWNLAEMRIQEHTP